MTPRFLRFSTGTATILCLIAVIACSVVGGIELSHGHYRETLELAGASAGFFLMMQKGAREMLKYEEQA